MTDRTKDLEGAASVTLCTFVFPNGVRCSYSPKANVHAKKSRSKQAHAYEADVYERKADA